MTWLMVALGGSLGALARFSIALALSPPAGKWPLATFIANILGSFLMGVGFYIIVERAFLGELWRHLLLVGFLGAFTTFSTFSIEVLSLLDAQSWKLALAYAISSAVAAIVAVFAGYELSKLLL